MVGLSSRIELYEVGLLDLWLERLGRSRSMKSLRTFLAKLRTERPAWTETVLGKGQIALARSQGCVRVNCLEGRALVTVEGDSRDTELRPGDSADFRGGVVAVTSMADASRVRMETT